MLPLQSIPGSRAWESRTFFFVGVDSYRLNCRRSLIWKATLEGSMQYGLTSNLWMAHMPCAMPAVPQYSNTAFLHGVRSISNICPILTFLELGLSFSPSFSYGPSVRVRAGHWNKVVDIPCVHEVRRRLPQGCDANIPHGRLQFILHDCSNLELVEYRKHNARLQLTVNQVLDSLLSIISGKKHAPTHADGRCT